MNNRVVLMSAAGVASAVLISAALANASGVFLNVTPSLPRGLWTNSHRGQFGRGEVVSFCPPRNEVFQGAKANGYLRQGYCPGGIAPLLKPVAAVGGDVVIVGSNSLVVNGVALRNSRPLFRDGAGRALPRISPGEYHVRQGEVWLVSTYNPASFDSRYFGPIPTKSLIGEARPLLIESSIR